MFKRLAYLSVAEVTVKRADLAAAAYVLGAVNGLVPQAVHSIERDGLRGAAFGTFGVSLVVAAAAVVGAKLASRAAGQVNTLADLIEFSCFFALLLLPSAKASWLAVLFLAAVEAGRGRRDYAARGAALLFALIAVSEGWSQILLQAFPSVLSLDAALSGWLLNLLKGGVKVTSNVLAIENQQGLVVLAGCSSLLGSLYAILCWTTVRHAICSGRPKRDLSGLFAIISVAVSLNAIRLALMGLSESWYEIVHGPVGANVYNAALLFAAILIASARAVRPDKGHSSSRHLAPVDRDIEYWPEDSIRR